ncbi:unnamed protein product [Anisakis simplex]|uniref:Autophagy protein 5 n=1 Tax=Anisakis simplex TaxID=6269 RepID=A0A0M3K4Q5_ANISI|nr:unnamed protein product [Anisakis simplex]
MPQDYEVTRKLWDGRVPVQFVLDSAEFLQRSTKPFCVGFICLLFPLKAMVPRMSYFPLILPRVLQYFNTVVEPIAVDSVWLQYNGQPLKWYTHYFQNNLLPYMHSNVEYVLKNFPKEVMRCTGDALESVFIQSIKEADQLKHKADIINSMKSEEHKQLWNGLVQEFESFVSFDIRNVYLSDRFDEFWSVNKKLMENSDSRAILHVPIRIYEARQPFRQILVTPYNENGGRRTLADVLEMIHVNETDKNVVSHGILLPSETPLLWMAENFCYLDNFIHIVLVPQSV